MWGVRVALMIAGLLLAQAFTPPLAAQERPGAAPLPGLTRQLMMSACYVKEKQDRPWKLKLAGSMPRGPGLYVIIYNEAGDIAHRAAVPAGQYTPERPYVVNVPADGKAQQYVIKFVGQQDNLTGLTLPLTDLPYEVYGDSSYAFGHGVKAGLRRIVAFQAPSSGDPLHLSGWRGNYRILDDSGAVVADSKDRALPAGDPRKKGGERDVEMIVTLTPGKTYWLDPYDVMYAGVKGGKLYLTFDPERWFEPSLAWSIQSRPWWKGLAP